MGFYSFLRRAGKSLLHAGPKTVTNVKVAHIDYGDILKDKAIIVTGGSKGIGHAMAKRFVEAGAEVIIAGRDVNALQEASQEIGCKFLTYDVSKTDASNQFIQDCVIKFGKEPDCLVCNAGVSLHEQSIFSVTDEGYDKQFDTNLKGAYFLAQAFLSQITSEKSSIKNAQILFISSETGDMAYDIPYGLSKAAINSLVGGLSKRFYKQGIRVNAIAPGLTVSNMTDTNRTNLTQYGQASGRLFLPEEVAEVACFLLSDASMCISGEVIHCNAGNHLRTNWE